MPEIQTTTTTDTNQFGLKIGVASKKEANNLRGKGESRTLLQSYGGMLTSWKDLNKGNLKGRET